MRNVTGGLTTHDEEQLQNILRKWNGGELSDSLFTIFAGMIPQPIVEVVLFRWYNNDLETLLIPRPKNDIVWPGMYHTPGTALRLADFSQPEKKSPLNCAFDRLRFKEVGLAFLKPEYVTTLDRITNRGPEVARIFTATLESGQRLKSTHRWYSVEKLPDHPNFMMSQLEHVQVASFHFRLHNT